MIGGYITLNFGVRSTKTARCSNSSSKLLVSISLGLWSTLLIYLISIPLGVRKAVMDGTRFDAWTSAMLFVGYPVPGSCLPSC